MINENVEMSRVEANAKVIADLNKEQTSFMETRAEKRKADEMKMVDRQN